MKTCESKEMYLETILLLQNKGTRKRAVDVATELGFSRPSVSIAVKNLIGEGLVSVDKKGELSLTDTGLVLAKEVYERHCVLKELFIKIGAEETSAEQNACRIEHIVSEDLFKAIKDFLNNN